MHRWPRTAFKKRTATLGLALFLHGLVLLMLLTDRVESARSSPGELEGRWIRVLPLSDLQAEQEVALSTERSSVSPVRTPGTEERPRSAIASLPGDSDAGAGDTGPIGAGAGPRVDWHAEAAALAARAATEVPRTSVGPPRERMRKPCTPRKPSFEFSPQEEDYGLLPLPYVRTGSCVFGLGFFTCSFGGDSRPKADMFDDMQQGLTPDSSVPHPEICD